MLLPSERTAIAPVLRLLALVVLAGCEPLAEGLDLPREEVPVFERVPNVPPPADPRALRVMAWNVKFAGARIDFWFDFWGDRVHMTRAEVRANLAGIRRLVEEVDPDVLLVEEIEVDSKRSAYVDMVGDILDHGRFNHAAYFQTWSSRFVPSEGLGRVDMGNAIFSKYPITFAERIRQPDRTDLDALTRTFYLHRAVGRAVIRAGDREIAAYVVHTEAYDRDGTKQRQLAQILAEVGAERRPLVLGGDFNELPPTAARIDAFDDQNPRAVGTEYEQPPYTPAAMEPFFERLIPAIPLGRIGATEESQRPFYTHTIRGPRHPLADGSPASWNRTLDHLFVSAGSWGDESTDVLQGPGRLGIASDPLWLSDHAPIVGTWELP